MVDTLWTSLDYWSRVAYAPSCGWAVLDGLSTVALWVTVASCPQLFRHWSTKNCHRLVGRIIQLPVIWSSTI